MKKEKNTQNVIQPYRTRTASVFRDFMQTTHYECILLAAGCSDLPSKTRRSSLLLRLLLHCLLWLSVCVPLGAVNWMPTTAFFLLLSLAFLCRLTRVSVCCTGVSSSCACYSDARITMKVTARPNEQAHCTEIPEIRVTTRVQEWVCVCVWVCCNDDVISIITATRLGARYSIARISQCRGHANKNKSTQSVQTCATVRTRHYTRTQPMEVWMKKTKNRNGYVMNTKCLMRATMYEMSMRVSKWKLLFFGMRWTHTHTHCRFTAAHRQHHWHGQIGMRTATDKQQKLWVTCNTRTCVRALSMWARAETATWHLYDE